MSLYQIKNLSIIDLDNLANTAYSEMVDFCISYDVVSMKDIKKLFAHFFFSNLLKLYSNRVTINVLLYKNNTISNKELDIITKPIFKLLRNKFKFPFTECNFPLSEYISLISDDSPEYDEAVNNNFNFTDSLGIFKNYIRHSGLVSLEKQYSNLKNISGLLLK